MIFISDFGSRWVEVEQEINRSRESRCLINESKEISSGICRVMIDESFAIGEEKRRRQESIDDTVEEITRVYGFLVFLTKT